MAHLYQYVPYSVTGAFSKLVTDYIDQNPQLREFYDFPPTAEGGGQAIAARKQFPVNREVLVDTLKRQYQNLDQHEKVTANIELLNDENTFTVCTAHQPNLMTGYLYFIFKILHAIKLADDLNLSHPGKRFVPVYYMGSEDADLDELGVFRFRGEKFTWDGGGQAGAVGRMSTASLKPLLKQLFNRFGPPGKDCVELQQMVEKAYLGHDTISEATQYLVNELFGRFGLIVINPDDRALKNLFVDVMEDELLRQPSLPIVKEQIAKIEAHYKSQAFPREINLFYLANQLRERIVFENGRWSVLNTDIVWDKSALLAELHESPERFSPNVILRGAFQETILPNVVFIGGGGEIAYWMQLNSLFRFHKKYFPLLLLRQSVLVSSKESQRLAEIAGLSPEDVFLSAERLINKNVLDNSTDEWQTENEQRALAAIFETLKRKAAAVDATLSQSADSTLLRMKKLADALEKKMFRAEKRKFEVFNNRVYKLKQLLFPGDSLQERSDNFLEYYLDYGNTFIDVVFEGILPMSNQFLIVKLL